jgi:TonB-dependent starch-binding outer membrane protein SusC
VRGRVVGFLLGAAFALPLALSAQVQTREVSGTVRESGNGQPLQGATVATVGVAGGLGVVRTNEAGQYRLRVPIGEVSLIARAIGFKRVTVKVGSTQATANFTLEKDVLQLEQVTITGQTSTIESRNATTAIAQVQAADLSRAPAQDINQQLQGKVLGATINMNSGAPGGAGQIQIRGASSVIGNSQPLIVVDGVIISNEGFSSGANTVTGAGGGIATNQDAVVNRLADINPNEIESMEVLKSAAATALYGSRATNGVVVIRTKKGAPGATRFNLTQRVGTQNALRNLGFRRFTDTASIVGLSYGNGATGASFLRGRFPNGQIPSSAYVDLEKELFTNPDPSYETIASLSGGTDKTQFFASFTGRREQGLVDKTGANLLAGRVNIDHTFNSALKVSTGVNVTRNTLRRGLSNNDNTGSSPIYAFAYVPFVIDLRQKDAGGNYVVNPFNGGGNATSNPFQTFDLLRYQEDVLRSTGFVNASWNAIESSKNRVSFGTQAGFDRFQQDGQLFSPANLQYEGNDTFFGRATQSNVNQMNYNLTTNATWTFTPGKLLSATTSVGTSWERQGINLYRLRGRGLLPGTTGAAQGTQDAVQDQQEFIDQAYVASTQILAFSDRLSFVAGIRGDRSSANGNRDSLFWFPRYSASYRIDNPVWKIDNVKFRFGVGNTGNRPRFTDRWFTLGTGPLIGGRQSLVAPGTVNNPSIRPERLRETEGGIDISLYNSRIVFEGTLFEKVLTDQLFTAPVAPASGVAQLVVNAGRLRTKGGEFGLSAIPIQSRDLTWTTRATWQQFIIRSEALPAGVPRFNVPGSFGAFFGRNAIVNGVPTTAIFGRVPVYTAGNGPVGANLPYGAILGAAANTFTVRDTVLGNSQPDFQMFFTNNISWKRFSVNFLVDWRKGGDVANMTKLLYDEGGNSRDYTERVPAGYANPGNLTLGAWRYATWEAGDIRPYVESGTNVRLRELSVSYDAPKSWADRLGARSLRLTGQGRNLWMKTNYWGYDPEFNNFGNTNLNRFIDLAPFPGVRSFFFSVDLGF